MIRLLPSFATCSRARSGPASGGGFVHGPGRTGRRDDARRRALPGDCLRPQICGESLMAWIKPEFEFVDLCSEVTTYLYHR